MYALRLVFAVVIVGFDAHCVGLHAHTALIYSLFVVYITQPHQRRTHVANCEVSLS